MKRSILSGLAAMCALAIWAIICVGCQKENPDDSPEGADIVNKDVLLKNNDVAAIVNWTYSQDAGTDHERFFSSGPAAYRRDEVALSVSSKSKNKIAGLKSAETANVTINSVYNRIDNKTEEPVGVTININMPVNDEVVAYIKNFEWGRNYSFTIQYGDKSLQGVIATVDRKRDDIVIELPAIVFNLNDTDAGYNKSTDTYTGSKEDIANALYNGFVANKIINADPANPDYDGVKAFLAKEGQLQDAPLAGDTNQYLFEDGFATAKVSPSLKLKNALDNGGRLVSHAASYCGQLVKIIQPCSVNYPDYDFMHLNYYTFNPNMEVADFITKRNFDSNDGSVGWWTQVYPSYFTTVGEGHDRISNRFALADYDISYIDLAELSFNVVDAKDEIMGYSEMEKANLSVQFTYADKNQCDRFLPGASVAKGYETYKNLWINGSTFYYRTCAMQFIPVRGILGVKSGNAVFDFPTRFDRPKASVKHPDIILDYSTFAVVYWPTFVIPKNPENLGYSITLDEHKIYKSPPPLELKDNRPNGVSFHLIKNGKWVVGNAAASAKQSSGTNGFLSGVKAYSAYRLDPATALKFDLGGLPASMKKMISVQTIDNMPQLVIDYSSEVQFQGKITLNVTFTLENPWQDYQITYPITIKGID